MFGQIEASNSRVSTITLCVALLALPARAAPPVVGADDIRPAPKAAAQDKHAALPLFAALEAADLGFPEQFAVVFEIWAPSRLLGPDYGAFTRLCKLTVSDKIRGLSITTEYHQRPAYRRLGEAGAEAIDYDGDGNLILWRPTRKWSLSTPQLNISRNDSEWLLINPDGAIVEDGERTSYYEYAIGNRDSIFEFHQFQLASGRGFTKRLSEDPRLNLLRDGTLSIVASGRYSGHVIGKWDLVAAPAGRSALTRAATFTPAGHLAPAIRVRTSGVFESDGIPLAQSGSITWSGMGNRTLGFTIISFSLEPDVKHVKELERLLRPPLPEGAHVIDMRKDGSRIPDAPERD